MKRRSLFAALLVLLAALIIGCGGGALNSNHHHDTTGTTATGTTSTTSTTSTTASTAGTLVTPAAGGTIAAKTGTATVVIPPNAVVQNVRVQVTQIDMTTTTLPAPPEGLVIVSGTAHSLSPDGLWFATPSSLTIGYDPTLLPVGISASAVGIYTLVGTEWQPVSGSVPNTTYHNVSCPLAHFSTYAILAPSSASGGPQYDVTDLGVLSGDTSVVPLGIGSTGKVCGYSTNAFGVQRAFLWSAGILTELSKRASDQGARANGVNAYGQAVGVSIQNSTTPIPILWSNGGVSQLAGPSGQTSNTAIGINDQGDVLLATAIIRSGSVTAFKDFVAGPNSGCLNSFGDVAGYAADHAAAWSGGKVVDLGILKGYDTSVGTALSDDGTVVGTAQHVLERKPIGFVWRGGSMTELDPMDGDDILTPSGVNTKGQIVATSSKDYQTSRGVIYQDGKMTDLNTLIPSTSGWFIGQALGINNAGQIIATGAKNGQNRALLLTPRPH